MHDSLDSEKYDGFYELNIHLAYSSYGKKRDQKASLSPLRTRMNNILMYLWEYGKTILGDSRVDQEIVVMKFDSLTVIQAA